MTVVFKTYKQRMDESRLTGDEVFQYDEIPHKLRVQISQILVWILGNEMEAKSQYSRIDAVSSVYSGLVKILAHEEGLPELSRFGSDGGFDEFHQYLLQVEDPELFLSAIELACRFIENRASQWAYRKNDDATEDSKSAIEQINYRMAQARFGYAYEGQIVRKDSEWTHSEITVPALKLLRDASFENVEQEFRKAHEHFLDGRSEEALASSLKAMESCLKTIFELRGWEYNKKKGTFAPLLKTALENELIPEFWEAHFNALKSTIEAGVPTGRNNMGGHGAGAEQRTVPNSIVSYCLNNSAAAILLFVQSHKELGDN